MPKCSYLSHRGTSSSIAYWQKFVFCVISHRITCVSTSQSSLRLWLPRFFFAEKKGWLWGSDELLCYKLNNVGNFTRFTGTFLLVFLECCSILLTKPLTIDYYLSLTDQISHSHKAIRKTILAAERLNFQRFRTECINIVWAPYFL